MVSPLINMPNTVKHSGVSGMPTQLLVNHSGECPLRGGYAQSLTNWANTTGVEASWHWFADPIAIVSMVDPMYAAWHASEANPLSEGFEQAGYARFSREEWLTPEGRKSIDNHAWIMARRMAANNIPHVWLSTWEVEQVTKYGNRSIKGLCNHRQIDPETRTDPGDNYPFDYLDERIRVHLGTTTEQDEDMAITDEDAVKVARALLDFEVNQTGAGMTGKINLGALLAETRHNNNKIVETTSDWVLKEVITLRELVKQLSLAQGVIIDYKAIAKAVNDDASARLKA